MVLMLMLTFEILMLMMLTWKKNTIGEDDSLCTAASALNNNFPAVSHIAPRFTSATNNGKQRGFVRRRCGNLHMPVDAPAS